MLLAIVMTFFVAVPANAEYVNRQTGPFDDDDTSYLLDWWDIEYLEVYDDTDLPGRFVTAVRLAGWPLHSQFWGDGYLLITLDVNGDFESDYALSAPDEFYPYDLESIDFDVFDIAKNRFVTGCNGITWMADGYEWDDDFIVFEFNKSCLPFGPTVNMSAGIDSEMGDFDYYDWATFRTGVASKPKVELGKPTVPTGTPTATSLPSSSPRDLAQLSEQVIKSVVQINCANGTGSGWAANATLSAQQRNNGYQTVIVTNNHVVEDCLGSGEVDVILNSGSTVKGQIFAADSTNDLAGVVIKSTLPTLRWQGDAPKQGWWVGVLGSPLNISGYLTTGIISKTGAFGDFYATSAALNPGNSGGPVFDRSGRVLGTATAKATDSEGIGLWVTAPDLCQAIFVCSGGVNQIWQAGLVATQPEAEEETPETGTGQSTPQLSSKNFSFPKFAANSAALSSAQKAKIAEIVRQVPDAQKFVCTSVVTDRTSGSNALLYRKRSKAVCDYAKSLNPSLSTWFQSKNSTKRSAEGLLLITVKY